MDGVGHVDGELVWLGSVVVVSQDGEGDGDGEVGVDVAEVAGCDELGAVELDADDAEDADDADESDDAEVAGAALDVALVDEAEVLPAVPAWALAEAAATFTAGGVAGFTGGRAGRP